MCAPVLVLVFCGFLRIVRVTADIVDKVNDAVFLAREQHRVDHINALQDVEYILCLLVVPGLGPVLIYGGSVNQPRTELRRIGLDFLFRLAALTGANFVALS